jgi:hypothetical protein
MIASKQASLFPKINKYFHKKKNDMYVQAHVLVRAAMCIGIYIPHRSCMRALQASLFYNLDCFIKEVNIFM